MIQDYVITRNPLTDCLHITNHTLNTLRMQVCKQLLRTYSALHTHRGSGEGGQGSDHAQPPTSQAHAIVTGTYEINAHRIDRLLGCNPTAMSLPIGSSALSPVLDCLHLHLQCTYI